MDLGGQTITKIRYFLKDGSVKDYTVNIPIASAGYVLMNIPYADFYKAELGETGTVDAISAATLKYGNKGVAGGSYHEIDMRRAVVEAGFRQLFLGHEKPALDALGKRCTDCKMT